MHHFQDHKEGVFDIKNKGPILVDNDFDIDPQEE